MFLVFNPWVKTHHGLKPMALFQLCFQHVQATYPCPNGASDQRSGFQPRRQIRRAKSRGIRAESTTVPKAGVLTPVENGKRHARPEGTLDGAGFKAGARMTPRIRAPTGQRNRGLRALIPHISFVIFDIVLV